MFKSLNEIIDFDLCTINHPKSSENNIENITPNNPICQPVQIGFRIILCIEITTPDKKKLHNFGWEILEKISGTEFKQLISVEVLEDLLKNNFNEDIINLNQVPKLIKWILNYQTSDRNAYSMAVKQHITEVGHTQLDISLIIKWIVRFQNNSEGIGSNLKSICEDLVKILAKIKVTRTDTTNDAIKKDVAKISSLISEMCQHKTEQYNDIVSHCLQVLYKLLTSDEEPSAYASVVFQLVEPTNIHHDVQWILSKNYTTKDADLKKGFCILCKWLHGLNFAPYLNTWILEILNGLCEQQKYDLLLDMSLEVIEKLFSALALPYFRFEIAPVVICILSSIRHTPVVFHKIVPEIPIILTDCKKSINESQKLYKDLSDIISALIIIFPVNDDTYKDIIPLLDPSPPNSNIREKLEDPPWNDTSQISIINTTNARVGLVNLGNTCYMNSVLQALVMTKQFSREILLSITDAPLFVNIQQLLALLLHSIRPELTPRDVLTAARPPDFIPGYQQDSSEFLGYLLEKLHEQEKTLLAMKQDDGITKKKWATHEDLTAGLQKNEVPKIMVNDCSISSAVNSPPPSTPLPNTLIQKTFDGKLSIIYKCIRCGSKSSNIDAFRDLQLSFPEHSDLKANYSVQKLLDFYCSSEKLNGDNQYFCDQCKTLCDGERSIRIVSPPRNLILTLKHFRYDQRYHTRAKLMNKVYHDEAISLNVMSSPDVAEHTIVKYVLYAAVVHSGVSMDSGHYYTYAADQPDCWYKFNDNFVTKCSVGELHNLASPNTPYILFYQMVPTDLAASLNDCIEIDDEFEEGSIVKKPCLIGTNAANGHDWGIVPLTNLPNCQLPELEELPPHLREFVHKDNTSYKEEIRNESNKKPQNKQNTTKLLLYSKNNRNRDSDNDEPPPNSCGGNSIDCSNKYIC